MRIKKKSLFSGYAVMPSLWHNSCATRGAVFVEERIVESLRLEGTLKII